MAEINVNKYADHKTYDGQPVPAGMVLVPVWFSGEIRSMDIDVSFSNLITWHIGGFLFLIGFVPIDPACFEDYMKWFWQGINAYTEERRTEQYSVETLPAPVIDPECFRVQFRDQSPTDWPDLDHPDICRTPPQTTRRPVSLDVLIDKYGFDPRDCSRLSPEDEALTDDMLSALLKHLQAIKPRYAEIAALGYAGLTPEEIIQAIRLKPSRGYQEIDACFRLAKDFIYSD